VPFSQESRVLPQNIGSKEDTELRWEKRYPRRRELSVESIGRCQSVGNCTFFPGGTSHARREVSRIYFMVDTATWLRNCPSIRMRVSAGIASTILKEIAAYVGAPFTLACGVMFMLGIASPAVAQDNGTPQPPTREQFQHIHTPQSIEQELARLTKDLELTPEQQKQVRPLVDEHHDKIHALLDKNPNASRKQLAPQIHAISDETYRKIHALLPDHQKELEKAMQQREHNGGENRRPAPPAAASPKLSSQPS
jgi:periplasmic protein CpxP/Spy